MVTILLWFETDESVPRRRSVSVTKYAWHESAMSQQSSDVFNRHILSPFEQFQLAVDNGVLVLLLP